MLKSLVLAILVFAPAAFAGEAYVTCRQVTWRYKSITPVYSLKVSNCSRVKTSFFETMDSKANAHCEAWSKEVGLGGDMYAIQKFDEQAACTKDEREFRLRELLPVRPVQIYLSKGSEYLWFQDTTTPYFDLNATREKPRWVHLNNSWYCGLPGQSFFVRYDFENGENAAYVEGLSLKTEKFEWRSSVAGTAFWVNTDSRSPFAALENTLNIDGHNTFSFKDKDGNKMSEFRMTYLVDVHRDPLSSCY